MKFTTWMPALLMMCSIGLFPLSESPVFQITTNLHHQRFPAIYNTIVVWEDNRNGNWDIYGYDLSTGKEFQITTDVDDQQNPAIYRNIVVWEDERGDIHSIYGYDLETRKEFQIATQHSWVREVVLYGNMVVWTDWRDMSCKKDIYGYDLETHQEFSITTAVDDQQNPAIYRNIVVWEDERHHDSRIYGYNLETRKEFQISPEPFLFTCLHRDPAIYENVVIWIDGDIIHEYNLETRKEAQIAAIHEDACFIVEVNSRNPAIYKEYVIWVDCRHGNPDIYGFNLKTKKEFPITKNRNTQGSPAIYENIVVWEDLRNGNWDIYGVDLLSSFTPVTFNYQTKRFLFDAGYGVLLAAALVFAQVVLGKKRYTTESSKEFKRNNFSFAISLSGGFLIAIIGFFFFEYTDAVYSLLYVVLFSVWAFNFIWKKRTPYCCITNNVLTVFTFLYQKPETMPLQFIRKVTFNLRGNRVEVRSYNEKISINLLFLDKKDRKDLIQMLEQLNNSS